MLLERALKIEKNNSFTLPGNIYDSGKYLFFLFLNRYWFVDVGFVCSFEESPVDSLYHRGRLTVPKRL